MLMMLERTDGGLEIGLILDQVDGWSEDIFFTGRLTCPSSALFFGEFRICLVAWSHFECVSSQA